MYIDSHAHLLNEFYEDISSVIKQANNRNVKKIINCAENILTSKEVVKLSKLYSNVYPAIGIHPEHAKEELNNINKLEEIIKKEKVIAIGEIGLDYYYGKENKKEQLKCFRDQLKLAEKYNLPVIIHSREATLDTINTLKEYKLKGIIHCFSGSVEIAKEYIKMGYKLGVNGIVTFKNSKKVKDVIKNIGIDNLALETDCPFLTPEPFRKYKNEPKYIYEIAKYLSILLEKDEEEIRKITSDNVYEVFDI